MYYGNYYDWTYGLAGGLIHLLIALIILGVILRFVSRYNRRNPGWRSWRRDAAEDLLKERYVKGEISKEEYEEKLRVIHGEEKKM